MVLNFQTDLGLLESDLGDIVMVSVERPAPAAEKDTIAALQGQLAECNTLVSYCSVSSYAL